MDRTRLGIAVACTTGNAVSMTPAVSAVFGVFLIPLSTEFGWPRAAISGVLGLIAVISALALPLVGQFADRYGARRLAIWGNLLLAAAIASLALTDGSVVRFYLSFAAIGVAGSIGGTAVLSKAVADWFEQTRGTILGISAGLGNGIGATVMPIAAALALPLVGWRGTYLSLAALVAVIGFPILYFLLRDAPRYRSAASPEDAGTGLTLAEAFGTPTFWIVIVAVATGAGGLTAIFSHVVPLLAERHIAMGAATVVISVFALATAAWQIAVGTMLDRIPNAKLASPLFLVAVPGLLLFETAASTPGLVLAGVLLGVGLGTQYGVLPYFIARYFGVRHFGAIIGTMYAVVALVQGATPILLDHIFDTQGSYRTGIVAIGVGLIADAMLLLLLPPYRSSTAVHRLADSASA